MAKVKLKNRKPSKLVYIEHVGAYDKIPYDEYFNKLFSWAKEKNAKPGFKSLGIFHDNPEKTPPESCKSEIGIPILGNPEPEGEIRVKELPAMNVAVYKHKGPSSEYPQSYGALHQWITQNGYEITGPTLEVYTKKPKVKGDQTILYSEIQMPIKKK
jgi:effector-binding domain-containing protein